MAPPNGRHVGQVIHDYMVAARLAVAGHEAETHATARNDATRATIVELSRGLAPMVEALWGDVLDAHALPDDVHELIARAAGRSVL